MKQLNIKIWRPDRKTPQKITLTAGQGRMFVEGAEDHILRNVADDLERQFPLLNYRMVRVGGNMFNFLYESKPLEDE